MRGRGSRGAGAMVVSALALTACGSSGSTTLPNIPIKSPVISGKTLPAQYTCDGRDISPPLEWGAVPAGVGNLALFVVGYTPEPVGQNVKISIAWAVAGLNPALHRLAAGRLPAGAFVGVATDGKRKYSICPKKGTSVQYQFELYGLPASTVVSRQFAGLPILTALINSARQTTAAHGAFLAIYKRR
jgi:phosphatidylethanolamine-binding protein (PEBP) family uncharacterized protein